MNKPGEAQAQKRTERAIIKGLERLARKLEARALEAERAKNMARAMELRRLADYLKQAAKDFEGN